MNRETPTDGTAPDKQGLQDQFDSLSDLRRYSDELKKMLNNLYGENVTGPDTDRVKEMANGILRQRQEIKRMMKATERDDKIRTILE